MKTLETAILRSARIILKNPKLKMDHIIEWSTGPVEARDGEIVVRVPNQGCNICINKICDRRTT